MHVLLIHQEFAGPDEPGTWHYAMARHLVASGHQVTIVTGGESHLSDSAEEPGLRILRVRSAGDTQRTSAIVGFTARALKAARNAGPVDLVWGTSPPLLQLLPTWLASLRAAAGMIIEDRVLWPELAIGMGVLRDGPLTRAALRFKRMMCRRARCVVVSSPGFIPFVERHGVARDKIEVIPDGVDVSQFNPEAESRDVRDHWKAYDRFIVVYAGALGPASGLELVHEAAADLRGTPALFVLVGDGEARQALMDAAWSRGLDNIRFVPEQPKRRLPSVLAAADACLATLRPTPLSTATYPSEVFEYMAAGRPVLLAIDGAIREVVEGARAGLFVPPGDGRALAKAVRTLMRSRDEARAMGQRGRRSVCARFDRSLHAPQIEALFSRLLSEREGCAPTRRAGVAVR